MEKKFFRECYNLFLKIFHHERHLIFSPHQFNSIKSRGKARKINENGVSFFVRNKEISFFRLKFV